MKKEFNLNELRRNSNFSIEGKPIAMYLEGDVKEFIKICLADGWDEQFVNPNEHFKAGVQFIEKKIIKYAGDRLT